MMRPTHPIARWGPVLIWTAIIFALSSQSTFPRGPDLLAEVLMRKLAHLTEYAVLAVLIARAIGGPRALTSRVALWALVGTFAYAVSDELHQGFVPLRMASATDVVIDLAGGVVGLGFWHAWSRKQRRGDRVVRAR